MAGGGSVRRGVPDQEGRTGGGGGTRGSRFISQRSVLSADSQGSVTPECDNHSWKMESAVRQTNSINTEELGAVVGHHVSPSSI